MCSVRVIHSHETAPSQCHMIALDAGTNSIIRAAIGYEMHAWAKMGSDFTVYFGPTAGANQAALAHGARGMFSEILRQGPFDMQVSEEFGSIVGYSDFQYFRPLKLRTRQTVRISPGAGTDNRLFSISTTLFVNRQNTGLTERLACPIRPDEKLYVQLIVDRIQETLRRTCSNMTWDQHTGYYEVNCPE